MAVQPYSREISTTIDRDVGEGSRRRRRHWQEQQAASSCELFLERVICSDELCTVVSRRFYVGLAEWVVVV